MTRESGEGPGFSYITTVEPRQYAPGVWYPQRIHQVNYSKVTGQNAKTIEQTWTVREFLVNVPVEEKEFGLNAVLHPGIQQIRDNRFSPPLAYPVKPGDIVDDKEVARLVAAAIEAVDAAREPSPRPLASVTPEPAKSGEAALPSPAGNEQAAEARPPSTGNPHTLWAPRVALAAGAFLLVLIACFVWARARKR
jgi:hypothetical protein